MNFMKKSGIISDGEFYSKYFFQSMRGKLGRDPRLFDYAGCTSLSGLMLKKTKYAFTEP